MSKLSELEIFVEVVDREGFSAAARSLDVSKSYVSKQIAALEERLGVRLLNRTTRQVTTTGAGAAFYERCVQIIDDIEQAERAIAQLQAVPRGTLRVAAPMSFGLSFLTPVIVDFMCAYPELEVDIHYSDRLVNIVEEGYDVALRIGTLSDSSLIGRRVAPLTRFVCASPDYLDAHGRPEHPDELRDHQCLIYSYQRTGGTWRLYSKDGEPVDVRVEGRMRANNGTALLDAARSGLGCLLSLDFIAAEDVRAGRLEVILPDWVDRSGGLWALYPHRRYLSAKVRLFVDFLVEAYEDIPWDLGL